MRNKAAELILFDVGGVLVESSDYLSNSIVEMISKEINQNLSQYLILIKNKRASISKTSIEKCISDSRFHYKNSLDEYQPDVSKYVEEMIVEQLNYCPSRFETNKILELFGTIEIRPIKPEAKKFIQRIRALGLEWGIVANTVWPSTAWRRTINQEFNHFLPKVAIWSSDIGYRKPNPNLIRFACNEVGIPTQDAIYIGNKKTTDMQASLRAGTKGVLLTLKNKIQRSSIELANNKKKKTKYTKITSFNELFNQLTSGEHLT